jgi:hypothetical protein
MLSIITLRHVKRVSAKKVECSSQLMYLKKLNRREGTTVWGSVM